MARPGALHPTDAELRAFADGSLDGAVAAALGTHLNLCDQCQTLIAAAPGLRIKTSTGTRTAGATPSGNVAPTRGINPSAGGGASEMPIGLRNHPRYRVTRLLGQGGMGAVYEAEHKVMERTVAIKVIAPGLVDSEEAIQRFQREVKNAAMLEHVHIVRAYDAEQIGDLMILAMEFVEGRSLADIVAAKGPLPVAYACQCARQTALGLQHAYEKGMVHRDIKPQNLMLSSKGLVKILDFGLAKLVSERTSRSGVTSHGIVMGTPAFMAPEQARDSRSADTRADIYALGCTLFFLLTGRPPFQDGTAVELIVKHIELSPPRVTGFRPDVPEWLADLIERMLAKNPAARPQTAKEIAETLLPFTKSAPATQIDPLATARTFTNPRRRWPIATAVAIGLALTGTLLWAGGVFKVKTPDGTIVVSVTEPDAEVLVDGETITVTRPDGEFVTIQRVPGRHVVEVKKNGFQVASRELVLDAGSKQELMVKLEPLPMLATPVAVVGATPPKAEIRSPDPPVNKPAVTAAEPKVVPPKPPVRNDNPPLNRWITLEPTDGYDGSFSDWKRKAPDLRDGILHLRNEWLNFERFVVADAILRCQIDVLRPGGSGGLVLRGNDDGAYHAWFGHDVKNGKYTGFWYTIEKSTGQHSTWKLHQLPNNALHTDEIRQGFFEVSFSAIGDRITLTVDGQKKVEVRDSKHARGWVGFNMYQKPADVKEIELKVLSK